MAEKRECPDTGTCHHGCTAGCWRVAHCEPLSIAKFPGNKWPADVKRANAENDGGL